MNFRRLLCAASMLACLAAASNATAEPQTPEIGDAPTLAGVYRDVGTNSNGSRYTGIAALQPTNDGYHFTWWIGRQVFTGVGRVGGQKLVVDWGQRDPVTYTLSGDRLEGEWANGSATDRLELFARATQTRVPTPEGVYRIAGRNPNGTAYSGTVSIVNDAGRFQVNWRTGARRYHGTGKLDSNLLIVNWGGEMPIVYALAADGSLRGLWEGGKGQETLTPE